MHLGLNLTASGAIGALFAALPAGLAMIGVGYQLYAAWAIRRFFATPPVICRDPLPISLLKPLHGAEPHLAANLASFLASNHAGPVQMVCGVNAPDDAAVASVAALITAHPGADIALSDSAPAIGANGKIGNLAAMIPLARHDIIVLSDSDMAVAPAYLGQVLGALMQPSVGAVSCLYVGRGDAGVWSRIGAAMITTQSAPNIIVGLTGGLARPCMGSTIALRRETLEAIGGFARFADVLADDYAMGEAVAALGLSVAVPPLLLTHAGAESSLRELWRHFLRWAVTIRDLRPAGHVGSVVTHPLPLALLALVLAGLFAEHSGLLPVCVALVAMAIAARLLVAVAMGRACAEARTPLWCIAAGDMLGFMVYGASLFARKIEWRGARLTMETQGRVTARDQNARDLRLNR